MWLVTVQNVYLTGRIRMVKNRFITCCQLFCEVIEKDHNDMELELRFRKVRAHYL